MHILQNIYLRSKGFKSSRQRDNPNPKSSRELSIGELSTRDLLEELDRLKAIPDESKDNIERFMIADIEEELDFREKKYY